MSIEFVFNIHNRKVSSHVTLVRTISIPTNLLSGPPFSYNNLLGENFWAPTAERVPRGNIIWQSQPSERVLEDPDLSLHFFSYSKIRTVQNIFGQLKSLTKYHMWYPPDTKNLLIFQWVQKSWSQNLRLGGSQWNLDWTPLHFFFLFLPPCAGHDQKLNGVIIMVFENFIDCDYRQYVGLTFIMLLLVYCPLSPKNTPSHVPTHPLLTALRIC